MSKLASLELAPIRVSSKWLSEPNLIFANDMCHWDPKVGIPLYGPRSLGTQRHKDEVHMGFIGTSTAIENAKKFYQKCALGIEGDAEHPSFPGFQKDRGFRCALKMDSSTEELITRHELLDIENARNSKKRFEIMVELLDRKMEVLTQKDHPLDYVVLVLSEELYKKCRSVDYVEKGMGQVHRDLRRAFKALAMKYHKPTQILLESTTGLSVSARKLDHQSVIAWNLLSGLYFKVDGLPWGPTGLVPSTCFVGISFFRPLGQSNTLRTSVVQAFDENGEGLVLRGHNFNWNEEKHGRQPHLDEGHATKLIEMVLERYQLERKQLPQRVVIHKSSRFEAAERAGFENALKKIQTFDLLALSPSSVFRVIREGRYPPLRGANYRLGDLSFIFTSGFIKGLDRYPHGHVPSPLRIADHVGDTSESQLLHEILSLTKVNWNSANGYGLMPITLRFSRLVGDILREIPEGQIPEPKYKYYM